MNEDVITQETAHRSCLLVLSMHMPWVHMDMGQNTTFNFFLHFYFLLILDELFIGNCCTL